jgi:hypothetical protein
VVSETSPEPKTAFVLAFDRQSLKLVALERYGPRDAAMPALFRHNDDGELAKWSKPRARPPFAALVASRR